MCNAFVDVCLKDGWPFFQSTALHFIIYISLIVYIPSLQSINLITFFEKDDYDFDWIGRNNFIEFWDVKKSLFNKKKMVF